MRKPIPTRRLSPVDAAFLYLEREEIPLAIASVSIFDGPIPFDRFVKGIRHRLPQIPRYRQVAVSPPYNTELPQWEDDGRFDIRKHIFHVTLPAPGSDAELEDLAGRVMSRRLDRTRPLWDIHVVDGLAGGRGAIIWRVHHALADGISGVGLLSVMMDSTPDGSAAAKAGRAPTRRPHAAAPSDGFWSGIQTALARSIAAEKGLLGFAEAVLNEGTRAQVKQALGLLPEFAASVERLPFNRVCGGERRFCWTQLDLDQVKAVRTAAGGKLNDVILTVLALALARYIKAHGESVVNRLVRVICPVSLRGGGGATESLGNLISFLPVSLPLDVRAPVRLLQEVAKRTETLKRGGAAELVGLCASLIASAPPALQALFWWGIPQVILPVPLLNLICTNIPGPATPLYAVGRRMLAAYPQVPTGWDLGVGLAVQSYDGKLCFGLLSDPQAAPDARRLRDFLDAAFQDLWKAAVGGRKTGKIESVAKTSATPEHRVIGGKPAARRRASAKTPPAPPAPIPEAAQSASAAEQPSKLTTAA